MRLRSTCAFVYRFELYGTKDKNGTKPKVCKVRHVTELKVNREPVRLRPLITPLSSDYLLNIY